jgi:hypothetical protein
MLKKTEKELGFSRMEQHKRNLILHASSEPPFDDPALNPTEFLFQFLSKKSQFKAKEMSSHRLSLAQMVSCIWNGDFLWLTPDCPSGISIFFCPELSSIDSAELEKDHYFLALADKVKHGEIEKKQNRYSIFLRI